MYLKKGELSLLRDLIDYAKSLNFELNKITNFGYEIPQVENKLDIFEEKQRNIMKMRKKGEY